MRLVVMPVVAGYEMTRRCVRSVLAQDIDVHLLAIDNGSTDGTGAYLRSLPVQRVTTITYNPAVSLHHAWNQALTLAFNASAAPVLVINNDVVLRPDTFSLLEADGGLFVTGVGVGTMEQMGFMEVTAANVPTRSPHPSFSCFLIRRECWERAGQFDEDFWVYCGDGDYHLRMDKAGIEAYSISVPFYHEISGTLKAVPRAQHEEICRRADADRATFVRKYGFAIGSPEYYASFTHSPKDNRYLSTGRLA